MHTVVTNAGVTQLLPHDIDFTSESPSDASSYNIWTKICCYCCLAREDRRLDRRRDGTAHGMPWGARSSKGPEESEDGFDQRQYYRKPTGNLSKDVFEKIQEVDNQSSTLSSQPQGFSQRVLERCEYCKEMPDGNPVWYVCQQVEIIKRPGQTLGLYIREGNGIDRSDGVFISRIAEGTDVEKHGMLKIGDEILTVNNVDVSRMSIDDVVIIMSIPRRLVLKTKFQKFQRGPAVAPPEQKKPVVVLKKVPRDESKDSSLGADEEVESSTAQTSLGAQARSAAIAQSQTGLNQFSEASERTRLLPTHPGHPRHIPAQVSRSLSHQQGVGPSTSGAYVGYSATVPQSQSYQAYPSTATTPLQDLYGPERAAGRYPQLQQVPAAAGSSLRRLPATTADFQRTNYSSLRYAPRVLDSQGLPISVQPLENTSNGNDNGIVDAHQSTLNAYVPPPKLTSQLVRRTESFKIDDTLPDSVLSTPYAAAVGLGNGMGTHGFDQQQAGLSPYVAVAPGSSSAGFMQQQQQPHHGYQPPQYAQYSSPMFSPRSVASDGDQKHRFSDGVMYSGLRFPPRVQRMIADDFSSDSDSGGGHHGRLPKSALRQPTSVSTVDQFQPSTIAGLQQQQQQYAAVPGGLRSNSLPRRRVGRVKWRNDVIGGSRQGLSDTNLTSDSDGAVSAPELPMSPSSNAFARERYRNSSTKTIDDIFTSAEYRAWNVQPEFSTLPRGRAPNAAQGLRSRDMYQRRPPEICNHIPVQTAAQKHSSVENLYRRSMDTVPLAQQSTGIGSGIVQGFGAAEPQPSATQDIRMRAKTRSSSLPPRGVLENAFGTTAGTPYSPASLTSEPLRHSAYAQFSPYAPQSRRYMEPVIQSLPGGLYAAPGAVLSQTSIPSYAFLGSYPVYPSARISAPPNLATEGIAPSSATTGGMLRGSVQQPSQPLTGMLIIHVMEGRGLKIPDKVLSDVDELYCVVEIDREHRARTSVTTLTQNLAWDESFEIECHNSHQADFFVYSWHPEFRHKLCHRGSLQLLGTFFEATSDRRFALNLEPRGQLMIRVHFTDMATLYQRHLSVRRMAYFGVPLDVLLNREGNHGLEVPAVFKRVVDEIERRGVDTIGIYQLCGSAEKKREVRMRLEREPMVADVTQEMVPDTNVLTGIVKDFLRELPEPLILTCIYQMLLDAWSVCLPNDKEGNVRLMLSVLDCLPRANKCVLMVIMDHLKSVCAQCPHNSMNESKLSELFGPLFFCTSRPKLHTDDRFKPVDTLDPQQANVLLTFLLLLWPSRASSSENTSTESENSTLNLNSNDEVRTTITTTADRWLMERQLEESNM